MKLFLLVATLLSPACLKAQETVPPLPLAAENVFAIRVDQQIVTYYKNIDGKRPVASTQKLLTALLIAEGGGLDERIPVKSTDGQVPPRNLWITEGSYYRRGTLLEMMLIRSFNDVTKCLARDHAGSQEAFAKLMNARAAALGMKDSHFVNAHGLTAEDQYSTANDMIKLALAAWENAEIRRITRIKNTSFTYHGAKTIPVKNSNDLLHSFPSCVGMKTGFTEAAGRCLVAAAEENGKTVLAVILGSTMEEVWNDAEKVIRYSLQF
ncbi:MAG: serine hydrolase [Verrucomicrobiales bacterium]|nr:serine hydrolase [Verrucomicrobiales bacterium]